MNNLRTLLRENTRRAHADLDRCLLPASGGWDTAAYERYLCVVAALEAHAADSRAVTAPRAGLPDLGPAVRRAVVDDLRRLEAESPEEFKGPAPEDAAVRGGAEHWGRAYVLEGAALGARVLLTAVNRDEAGHPTSALQVLAAAAGDRWARFAAALSEVELGPGDADAAVEAARAVFAMARSTADRTGGGPCKAGVGGRGHG